MKIKGLGCGVKTVLLLQSVEMVDPLWHHNHYINTGTNINNQLMRLQDRNPYIKS
jgi:hypothetical protein